MEAEIKAVFCWSGGKDSALALYRVLQDKRYKVISLLTTLSEKFKRISMHGVREELLDVQAKAMNLPIKKIFVKEGTYDEYENLMRETLLHFKKQGVETIIFGDIFLEDLRIYREKQLAQVGMKAHFPLWNEDTKFLIREFWNCGFQSRICCVDARFFNEEQVGKLINERFIHDLPEKVDPCGENGEFHSYCFDGPIFSEMIKIRIGEKLFRSYPVNKLDDQNENTSSGFWYCDLLLN